MNWYYVEAGQPVGPVEDAQLDALRREGRITDETMIFCEGMTAWQPYRVARAGTAAPSANSWAPGRAVCHECGKSFPTSDMIRHEPYYICAGCKPVFMQKLSEGATFHTGDLRYAGFWIRFAAIFLDGILITLVLFGLGAGVGLILVLTGVIDESVFENSEVETFFNLISIIIAMLYEGAMVGRYGATLGKMACGLKVVRSDGEPLTYARAIARYFGKWLSRITCFIGFIIAAFDDEKRALHDRICDTRVIHK